MMLIINKEGLFNGNYGELKCTHGHHVSGPDQTERLINKDHIYKVKR